MAQLLLKANEPTKADTFKTPPPTVKAPTPATTKPKGAKTQDSDASKVNLTKKLDTQAIAAIQGGPAPPTEAAKMARLRRLCEKKPSGKLNVPESVHQRWLNGTLKDREALVEELEGANWSKDPRNVFNIFHPFSFRVSVTIPDYGTLCKGGSEPCCKKTSLFWLVCRTCSSPGWPRPLPRAASYPAKRREVGSLKSKWLLFFLGASV